jgi:hypothetical protein
MGEDVCRGNPGGLCSSRRLRNNRLTLDIVVRFVGFDRSRSRGVDASRAR